MIKESLSNLSHWNAWLHSNFAFRNIPNTTLFIMFSSSDTGSGLLGMSVFNAAMFKEALYRINEKCNNTINSTQFIEEFSSVLALQ
jgi:hypothetical protein